MGLFKAIYPPPPRQTCSFQRQLDFSGKHSATFQLLHEDYSFTYPPLSIARCSFIQLSELRQCGVNEIAQALKQQPEDSKPGSLDCVSAVLTSAPPPPPRTQCLDYAATRRRCVKANVNPCRLTRHIMT